MDYKYVTLVLFLQVYLGSAQNASSFVTQTVYGFLDFTTTIHNTVMVFSPQSAPALDFAAKIEKNIIETKPIIDTNLGSEDGIKPTKSSIAVESSTDNSDVESISTNVTISTSEVINKVSQNNSEDTGESVLQVKNNLYLPEYDLLSRQPAEYAEETYRVVNFKSNPRNQDKNRAPNSPKKTHEDLPNDRHTVGLVTKLSGTEAKDGTTTIHETSVIGTYISGKYAQVLQSSSSIHHKNNKKHKIRPSSSLRVLKTAAPAISKPTPSSKSSLHRQSTLSPNRHRNKHPSTTENSDAVVIAKSASTSEARPAKTPRHKSKRKNKGSRASSQASFSSSTLVSEPKGRRNFRPSIQPSTADTDGATSLYMFKLNRAPGRWQYKSSPKPRVTIRKNPSDNTPNNITISSATSINDQLNNDNQIQNVITEQGDLESSGSQNGAVLNNVEQENKPKMFIETLNVEISTPADFKDTYYEIATIKTPFTFQAGVVKKTRFITVTSTVEKVLTPEPSSREANDEPLTENILLPSTKIDNIINDESITTLSTIYLTDDAETPSLETITESFSITQTKLRTQILPIVQENRNETKYITLVQTYDVTSLITATKTLHPLDANQFISSKNFKDFGGNLDEAGSEINLELEFGDEDNFETVNDGKPNAVVKKPIIELEKQSSLPLPPLNLNQNLNPQQAQQLALLNIFNPSAGLPTVITTSRPVIRQKTLWESYVVPIVNGLSTNFRTLSKSVGVVDNTEFVIDTTTIPLPLPVPPPVSVNPYLLQVPQQYQPFTSSVVHQTMVTETRSKILKLTFGAKTAYTTIFSTQVVPTALTMLITTTMPIQPSAAFPGYYPPPYPPYAYVG